jgi:hypothetical protein
MFLVSDAHLKCSSVFDHFVSVYEVLEVMFFGCHMIIVYDLLSIDHSFNFNDVYRWWDLQVFVFYGLCVSLCFTSFESSFMTLLVFFSSNI